MALRIGHGPFRMWLILSVLWIGGVALGVRNNLPQDEVVLPSGRAAAPPTMSGDLIPKRTETKPPFDPSKPYTVVRDKERREAIRTGSIIALVPPVIVLVVGSALIWAFRGFR